MYEYYTGILRVSKRRLPLREKVRAKAKAKAKAEGSEKKDS